ncbi:uncharacterized protein FOMMEDRAFT_17124 [Fomitiporia mediterranea MF3/22]|uniref:uncharacterized protein n=1 Tax=Fomitiporia mediterranea (strain MF3/22) TaxID=694068 RepID=UPI0004408C61|nr:uncharacterized protein FOMMEDRAFT_17124 [Fomitiporia mediterranea MF3/22]EJD06634.1 hypothetical protein FOMMEDRAFT_17124 [Fomitiporia mediterranea MF3/22]
MSNGLVDLLAPVLRDVANTRYSELASSAIIVHDYFLTLDQEIQFIWKARWTIGKVLFFLNRYYTLFVVAFNNYGLFSPSITDDFCQHWFNWQGWTGLIAAALAETILQLRLYALYYGNKKVLGLMICFFIFAMASSAAVMGTVLRDVNAKANLIPGTKFCIPLGISTHFYAFWIPILSFETLLCALACMRGYKSYRDHEIRRLGRLSMRHRDRATSQQPDPKRGEMNILEILLRDSVGYFIIIFATYLTTTMIWIFGPVTVIEIPVGFTVALSSVIANRLLLNLRGSQARMSSSASASGNHVHNNPNSSSYIHTVSIRDGSVSHISDAVGVATTVEDEQGREVSGYELHALRNLKASV